MNEEKYKEFLIELVDSFINVSENHPEMSHAALLMGITNILLQYAFSVGMKKEEILDCITFQLNAQGLSNAN
jgi:hypothetical protein